MSTLHLDLAQTQEQQLDELLRTLPAPEEPARGVVADWPVVTSFLADPSWEILFKNVWSAEGGAVSESVLRRPASDAMPPEEQRLAVKIYVSSLGPLEAREYFLRQALSPAGREPLYELEKHDDVVILRLAAPLPAAGDSDAPVNNDSLLLLYRNVVFDLRSYQSTVNVRRLGLRLQHFAEQFAGRELKAQDAPASQLAHRNLDQEIVVDLPATPDPFGDFRGTDFDVKIQASGAVAFLGFQGPTARFQQLGPGEGSIRVQTIHRRTLLASEVAVNLP
ncbi:MAG: hypothetical protein ABI163_26520 [Thermoanaerobaculia bacterium]